MLTVVNEIGPDAPVVRAVTIEMVPGAEPISGQVSDSAGRRRPFSGWMELIVALQQANVGVVVWDDQEEKS
jgi:hypothetical protein